MTEDKCISTNTTLVGYNIKQANITYKYCIENNELIVFRRGIRVRTAQFTYTKPLQMTMTFKKRRHNVISYVLDEKLRINT